MPRFCTPRIKAVNFDPQTPQTKINSSVLNIPQDLGFCIVSLVLYLPKQTCMAHSLNIVIEYLILGNRLDLKSGFCN